MKKKGLPAVALLLFVAVSVVYGIVRMAGEASSHEDVSTKPSDSVELMAYYFHGYSRCITCRTIEAYSREAFESGFSEKLKTGRFQFRSVNVEEAENEHFVQDFSLTNRTLVLVKMEKGKSGSFRTLDRVWELVHDHDGFIRYVQSETTDFMKDSG